MPYWVRITARGTRAWVHSSARQCRRPHLPGARADRGLPEPDPADAARRAVLQGPRHPGDRSPPAALVRRRGRGAAGPGRAGFFTANPYYNALLRKTISITVLHGSDKTNVIPPEASAELDVRLLPGVQPADFVRRAARRDRRFRRRDHAASPGPPGHDLTAGRRADRGYPRGGGSLDPGALITTTMLTGFTDSYYYRALGIGAYGLSPFRPSEEDARTVHGQ